MSQSIQRLLAAFNEHDLEAAAALFHESYNSVQPAHPARAFVGRAQMHANWAAISLASRFSRRSAPLRG